MPPPTSSEGDLPDLRLHDVAKRFGEVVALDAVTLDIERGEFVTLLGPSGCGKTTTLRIVAGFEAQTAGSVSIRGERVDGVPPYRRNVNTVFQNYALFPHLSVFDNVAFGLRVKARSGTEIRRTVGQALDQVRLGGLDRRRPHELSGGSNSGSRSRGPSSISRRFCSWTSRWGPSTSSSGRRCSSSSSGCTGRSASHSST